MRWSPPGPAAAKIGPIDWGQGSCERIDAQVLPAAEELIAVAAPQLGETVAYLG